jgi:hypothetical protein
MTAAQLRRRIAQRLNRLSPKSLRKIDDFAAHLEQQESEAATRELLAIPGFRQSLRRGQRQVAAGKTVPFAEVRRHL